MINPVIRAVAIYLFLLIVFRFLGKRRISQATTFDFVLLLIISEATQDALLAEDTSLTNAFILIATMIGMNIALNLVKNKWNLFDKVAESIPLLLFADGNLLKDRMAQADVEENELLESARRQFGFTSLRPVRYAVLEIDGSITIIPKEAARSVPEEFSGEGHE